MCIQRIHFHDCELNFELMFFLNVNWHNTMCIAVSFSVRALYRWKNSAWRKWHQ